MRRNVFWPLIALTAVQAHSQAELSLPEIGKDDLLKTLNYVDSLSHNIVAKYVVDEQFNQAIHKAQMPEERHLEIEWRRQSRAYYYDVATTSETMEPGRIVSAFNGEKRMQWVPNEEKGDIFNKDFRNAWPIPIDFGMTLGKHDEGIGATLSKCTIDQFERREWEGRECYFVEATQRNGAKVRVWIDPNAGWRARHLELYWTDGSILYEASAVFEEHSPGVWLPKSGEAKLYGVDPSTGERVVSNVRKLTVTEMSVNEELRREDFEVEFPVGTAVYDHVVGIGYVVGTSSIDGVEEQVIQDIVETARGQGWSQPAGGEGASADAPADSRPAGRDQDGPSEAHQPAKTVGYLTSAFPWALVVAIGACLVTYLWIRRRRREGGQRS